MSTPQSIIKICSGIRLNQSYEHTIYFDSLAEQEAFFAERVVKTFSAYTFLRKSWNIKVDATMDEARQWNYLYFRNTNNKPFYYFITNIEYINDNTVELSLEMDVMQTYHFDYQLLKCFVEREHSATDNIGDNVVDEGLELGEFVINNKVNLNDLNDLCIMMLTTVNPGYINANPDIRQEIIGSNVGGVFSGMGVVVTQMEDWSNLATLLHNLGAESEAILTIWMYPKVLIGLHSDYEWDNGVTVKIVNSNVTYTTDDVITRNTTLNGYTPRNKKLLTHPYNFIYVSNNDGGYAIYHYERFLSGQVNFNVCGAISPDAQIKLYPLNYNNDSMNYDEGLIGQKFPTCAWNQDVYKLWLAQNQAQQALTMISGVSMIAGGIGAAIATGGVGAVGGAGTAIAGLSQITNLLAQRKDMSVQPPQAKGNHSANVNVAHKFSTFTIFQKSVDAYHAKMIDDYFDLYGYKTAQIKYPNRNVRENWTYIKTVGCHISGYMCTEDITKIESIYNNGITFWRNGDRVGDYSYSNKPLLEVGE